MTYRSRVDRGLRRLNPANGGLSLSNWIVFLDTNGLGQISENPTSSYYLTTADSDALSFSPGPIAPAYEWVNPIGNDFRVQYREVTKRNTTYRVSVPRSSLTSSPNHRLSITLQQANGTTFISPTVISGSTSPFGAFSTVVLEFTTPNSDQGDLTHLRINSHSTTTDTQCWIGLPVFTEQ